MKRGWVLGLVFVVLTCFSGMANAILHDRGGGLIYDDVLMIRFFRFVQMADHLPAPGGEFYCICQQVGDNGE